MLIHRADPYRHRRLHRHELHRARVRFLRWIVAARLPDQKIPVFSAAYRFGSRTGGQNGWN